MDDLNFLEDFPKGDATLCIVHTGGSTSTIAGLNLDTIENVSPVLAHAFENTENGPKHSIEEMSSTAVASLLRHVYTSQNYVPEIQLDEQTSLMLHVEIYCLAVIYDIPTLKTIAKGRISTELMLAISSPEPPQDLCKALDFIYEHLSNERDLVDTLAHYCISCLLTHKLNENDYFKKVHGKHHQLQKDLCSVVRSNEFEDETAAAIIQLSIEASPAPPVNVASPLIDLDEESEEKIHLRSEVDKLKTKVEGLNQQLISYKEEIRMHTFITSSRDFYRDKLAAVAQRDRTMHWDKQQLKATVESQNLEIQKLRRELEATRNEKISDDVAASDTDSDATRSDFEEYCRKGAVEEGDQENAGDFDMLLGSLTGDAQHTAARQGSRSSSGSDSDYDMIDTPTESRTVSPEPIQAETATQPESFNLRDTHSRAGDASDEEWSVCGTSDRGRLTTRSDKQNRHESSSDTMEVDHTEKTPELCKSDEASIGPDISPQEIIHDLIQELKSANAEVEFLDEYVQSLYEAQATLVRQMDTARLDEGDNRWTIHSLNLQLERLIEQARQPATDLEWGTVYIQSKQRELQKAYERIHGLRDESLNLRAELDHTRLNEQNAQGAINRLRDLISQHRNEGKSQEQTDWDIQWEAKQRYRSQAEEIEYLADAVEHTNSFIDGLVKTDNTLRNDLLNHEIRQKDSDLQISVLQSRYGVMEDELDEARNELEDLGFHLECADVARRSVEEEANRKQEACQELLDENKRLKAEKEALESKTQYFEGLVESGLQEYIADDIPDPDNNGDIGSDGLAPVVGDWDKQDAGGSGGGDRLAATESQTLGPWDR